MNYKISYKIANTMDFCLSDSNISGVADDAVNFLIEKHFTDPALWAKFVDQFRIREDGTNGGWRGEYWGKMMRGAVMLYQHSKSKKLFDVLTETVNDMLTVGNDGRVSSYSIDTEFTNWDMWSRKYVMLGLEYYLEICEDNALCARIIDFVKLVADYVIDHIGDEEGKIKITDSSKHWKALNSCSILEPMTKLYRFTGDEKYLDFSKYIVDAGGARGINIFELAYENKIPPYQYGAPKAYELMSCFEGLIEYALITGNERYKTSAINFAKKIIETEVTVIGCCGITHELLDHSRARQTAFYGGVSQETCVTVTWMKFCSRLLRLTGDPVFAEELERSFYNAYLGALNVENKHCNYVRQKAINMGRTDFVDVLLPFDSYSPLIPGKRGQKTGGSQILSDGSYYGCCACIGGAGVGSYLQSAITSGTNFVCINFLFNGKQTINLDGTNVIFEMFTEYPVFGNATLKITAKKAPGYDLKIRIPEKAENIKLSTDCKYAFVGGYIIISEALANETSIGLSFDMPITVQRPVEWKEDEIYDAEFYSGKCELMKIYQDEKDLNYVCLTRGPLVLAADSSFGKDAASIFDIDKSKLSSAKILRSDTNDHIVTTEIEDVNGETFVLTDYGTCGRDWNTVIAAWLPTK